MAVMVSPSWVAQDVGGRSPCHSETSPNAAPASVPPPGEVSSSAEAAKQQWWEESIDGVSPISPSRADSRLVYEGESQSEMSEDHRWHPPGDWERLSMGREKGSTSEGKPEHRDVKERFGSDVKASCRGEDDSFPDVSFSTPPSLAPFPSPPTLTGTRQCLAEGEQQRLKVVPDVSGKSALTHFGRSACTAPPPPATSQALPRAATVESPARRGSHAYSSQIKVPALPKSTRTFLSQMLRRSLACLGAREGKEFTTGASQSFNVEQRQPPNGITKPDCTDAPDAEAPAVLQSRLSLLSADEEDGFCDARSECTVADLPRSESVSTPWRASSRFNPTPGARRGSLFSDNENLMSRTMSGFESPLGDVMSFTLSNFEERRRSFIERQRKFSMGEGHVSSPDRWNRREELMALSELLVDVSRQCANEDPSSDCPAVLDKDGLRVWKKEFGIGRLLVRASFIVPVTPQQYCAFVSDQQKRRTWDKNVAEVRRLECLSEDSDISYLAVNRVATVFPRDSVNLRVRRGLDPGNLETGPFTSCSCSVEHPDVPEQPGRVRMDIRISCYMANPVETPFGTWSRISLFSEGDPKGWIPGAVTKMVATRVVPSTVEKLMKNMMSHYGLEPDDGGSWMGWAYRKLLEEGIDPATLVGHYHSVLAAPHENVLSSLGDFAACDAERGSSWKGRTNVSASTPSSIRAQLYPVSEEEETSNTYCVRTVLGDGSGVPTHETEAVPIQGHDISSSNFYAGQHVPQQGLEYDGTLCHLSQALGAADVKTSFGARSPPDFPALPPSLGMSGSERYLHAE